MEIRRGKRILICYPRQQGMEARIKMQRIRMGGCDGYRSVVVRTYLYVGWKKAVGYGKQRNVGDILLMF